jgi:hypothetical protein
MTADCSWSLRHTEKNLKALRPVLEALGSAAHLAFVGDGPFRPELEAHFSGTQTTFTVRPQTDAAFSHPTDADTSLGRGSKPRMCATRCDFLLVGRLLNSC